MKRLCAGVCFFDDCAGLKRLLDSLKDFDLVICVDGKFLFYEADHELSIDGSRELVKSYPNTVLLDGPNLLEPDKRNIYMQHCKDYDALVSIDTDEWLEGDVRAWKEGIKEIWEQEIYSMEFQNKEHGIGLEPRPRLFVPATRYRFHRCHNFFKDLQTGEISRLSYHGRTLVSGVVIKEDDKLRSKEWVEKTLAYQFKLIEYEKPLKREMEHR